MVRAQDMPHHLTAYDKSRWQSLIFNLNIIAQVTDYWSWMYMIPIKSAISAIDSNSWPVEPNIVYSGTSDPSAA